MRTRTLVSALALAWTGGCADPPSMEGTWHGYVPGLIGGQDARVEMVLEDGFDGSFRGTLEARQMPVIGAPVTGRVDRQGEFRGAIDGVGSFSGSIDERIRLDVDVGGRLPTVTLNRDDPEFVQFAHPRVDAQRQPIVSYVYRPPAERGDGLPVGHLGDHGMRVEPIESLVEAILAGDFPRADGLLIVKDGTLVVEEYFYGHDGDQLHTAQSVTKSVLALLVGQAIADGYIASTSTHVHEFFSDYAGTAWIDTPYPVSVHDALAMSGGLDWDEQGSYLDLENPAVVASSMSDPLPFIFDRPSVAAPGTTFVYNSGLSMVLGALLVRAAGVSVQQYADRRLFEPLGIDDAYWRPLGSVADDASNADTGGGLFLRGRDFAKLGLLVLSRGSFAGQTVVEPEWIDALFEAQTPTAEYGYHWWRLEYELAGQALPVAYASGFGGQRIWVAPAFDLVVVQTSLDFEGLGSNPERQVESYIVPALQ